MHCCSRSVLQSVRMGTQSELSNFVVFSKKKESSLPYCRFRYLKGAQLPIFSINRPLGYIFSIHTIYFHYFFICWHKKISLKILSSHTSTVWTAWSCGTSVNFLSCGKDNGLVWSSPLLTVRSGLIQCTRIQPDTLTQELAGVDAEGSSQIQSGRNWPDPMR